MSSPKEPLDQRRAAALCLYQLSTSPSCQADLAGFNLNFNLSNNHNRPNNMTAAPFSLSAFSSSVNNQSSSSSSGAGEGQEIRCVMEALVSIGEGGDPESARLAMMTVANLASANVSRSCCLLIIDDSLFFWPSLFPLRRSLSSLFDFVMPINNEKGGGDSGRRAPDVRGGLTSS